MSKSLFIDFMEKMLAFPLWIKQTIFLNLSNDLNTYLSNEFLDLPEGELFHIYKPALSDLGQNELLTKEIAPRGIGTWVNPLGGYFISFESLEGCAKQIVAKCKEAGVTMTGAGAPFPYGKDPKDNVIRIAPTFPSLENLTKAAEVFVVVVRLVSAEKLLND